MLEKIWGEYTMSKLTTELIGEILVINTTLCPSYIKIIIGDYIVQVGQEEEFEPVI